MQAQQAWRATLLKKQKACNLRVPFFITSKGRLSFLDKSPFFMPMTDDVIEAPLEEVLTADQKTPEEDARIATGLLLRSLQDRMSRAFDEEARSDALAERID